MSKIKQMWSNLSLDGKVGVIRIVTLIFAVILIAFMILHFTDKVNESNELSNQQDGTLVKTEDGVIPKLGIRYVDEDRHLDNIYTYRFEIYNQIDNSVTTLNSGTLSMDDVIVTIEEFLKSHPYKVYSVGLVDDKFYVQQDINQTVDRDIRVNIISLIENFNSEDWLNLTEATYKNADVMADNLFAYDTAKSKHYIYIYLSDTDKDDNTGTEIESTDKDSSLEANGNIILDS